MDKELVIENMNFDSLPSAIRKIIVLLRHDCYRARREYGLLIPYVEMRAKLF